MSDEAYEKILEILDGLDWERALELGVTKIRPTGMHVETNFFPGERGFFGDRLPIGGIMLVANNFESLDGWKNYESKFDFVDTSQTSEKLRNLVLPATGVPLSEFWLTNFALGVMDKASNRYAFPARVVRELNLKQAFASCVAIMKPRLIVAFGRPTADALGADYKYREEIRIEAFGGHRTSLMAAVHTSAWTWGPAPRNGFTREDFQIEGRRIGDAARNADSLLRDAGVKT